MIIQILFTDGIGKQMIHVDLLAKFVIAKFVFPNLDLM